MGANARQRGRARMDRLERAGSVSVADDVAYPRAGVARAVAQTGYRKRSVGRDRFSAFAGRRVCFRRMPARGRRGAQRKARLGAAGQRGKERGVQRLSPRANSEGVARRVMPRIESRIDTAGEMFAANRAHVQSLLAQLRATEARTRARSQEAGPRFAK